jgi:hypothetical protein
MKKLILTLVAVCLTGACFAPINLQEKPTNGVRYNEATQQELGSQQTHNGRIDEVGSTQMNTSRADSTVDPTYADPEGRNALSQAEAARSNMDASLTMKGAMLARKEGQSSPWKYAIWAAIIGALGYGLMFSFRNWVDKNAPELRENRGTRRL